MRVCAGRTQGVRIKRAWLGSPRPWQPPRCPEFPPLFPARLPLILEAGVAAVLALLLQETPDSLRRLHFSAADAQKWPSPGRATWPGQSPREVGAGAQMRAAGRRWGDSDEFGSSCSSGNKELG